MYSPNEVAGIISYSIFGTLLLVSFLLTKPKKQESSIELVQYGLFIIAILIGAGFSWQHHFVMLIIPYIALFLLIMKDRQKSAKLFFIDAVYLLSFGSV